MGGHGEGGDWRLGGVQLQACWSVESIVPHCSAGLAGVDVGELCENRFVMVLLRGMQWDVFLMPG